MPSELWTSVLKSKYCPHTSIQLALKQGKCLYMWTTLLWGQDLLLQGLGWKLGTGSCIQVWHENWIPSPSYFKPYVNRIHEFPSLTVSQLIDIENSD